MNSNTGKPYLYYLISIVIVMAVVVVVYASLQAGMFGALIGGVVGLGVALLFFSWLTAKHVIVPLANVRLQFLKEHNEHDVRKLEMQHKYKALPAPKRPRVQDTDPRRADALKLLKATIDHEDYGPQSDQIISADDAQAAGVMNRSKRQQAVALLAIAYHVSAIDAEGKEYNGTWIPAGRTALDLYNDMIYGNKTALDEAVMAIPEAGRR